jgi:heme A synthase
VPGHLSVTSVRGTGTAGSPVMPSPSRGADPDPLAHEVDRLLAQLSGTSRPSAPERPAVRRPITRVYSSSPTAASSHAGTAGLWLRVALVLTLGAAITQWPYPHDCGWPLTGYLCAVTVVLVAGLWIGHTSWRLRSAAAHVLAILVLFWSAALVGERVLPRVGYAADRAGWSCPVSEPGPR